MLTLPEEGEAAELQYSRYGDTNLPLLSPEGWLALDKRQIAGLQAIEARFDLCLFDFELCLGTQAN
jgi:hypothetical protein